jgi:hypothetical protein
VQLQGAGYAQLEPSFGANTTLEQQSKLLGLQLVADGCWQHAHLAYGFVLQAAFTIFNHRSAGDPSPVSSGVTRSCSATGSMSNVTTGAG